MSNLTVESITLGSMQNKAGLKQTTLSAWAYFNGKTNVLTAGSNISSVVDNGTGDYTFNFTKALPSTNYIVLFGLATGGSGNTVLPEVRTETAEGTPDANKTAGKVRINCKVVNGTGLYDMADINMGIAY